MCFTVYQTSGTWMDNLFYTRFTRLMFRLLYILILVTSYGAVVIRYYRPIITFRLRPSRGEMYIGHGHLCVCPLPHSQTTARTRMQLSSIVGGALYFSTVGRICNRFTGFVAIATYSAKREMSASACTRSMPGSYCVSLLHYLANSALAARLF